MRDITINTNHSPVLLIGSQLRFVLSFQIFLWNDFTPCRPYRDHLSENIGKISSPLPCWTLQPSIYSPADCRLVHLDVEDCSEELLRQQSYAIKNQLGHPNALDREIPRLEGILLAPRWFFMA